MKHVCPLGLALALVILGGVGASSADDRGSALDYKFVTPMYQFVPRHGKRVRLLRARFLYAGTIDSDGRFVADPGFGGGACPVPMRMGWEVFTIDAVNTPAVEWERVYEFRSGKLVEGKLRGVVKFEDMFADPPSGTFVATPGGEVIDVKNYRPDKKNALRIYNLPGEFVIRP